MVTKNIGLKNSLASFAVLLMISVTAVHSQDDPAYRTRRGDCAVSKPAGKNIPMKVTDSKIISAYGMAERLISYTGMPEIGRASCRERVCLYV